MLSGAASASLAGRHPGRGFARRKHAARQEESPFAVCVYARVFRRPQSHMISDVDTRRLSHAGTAPKLLNVSPGTPGAPRSRH